MTKVHEYIQDLKRYPELNRIMRKNRRQYSKTELAAIVTIYQEKYPQLQTLLAFIFYHNFELADNEQLTFQQLLALL